MGNSRTAFEPSRNIAVYVGIAAAYAVSAWAIGRAVGSFTPDPDYAYLLSGLDMLSLKAPVFVDHPGTPVQTIIAIVLGLTWIVSFPWHGFSSVQDQVLLHPEFYMECVNGVFATGNAAAMVFFAWSMRKSSGMLAPALVGLISIFQSDVIYMTYHRTMPESVLLAATLVLAGFIAQSAYASDDAPQTRRLTIIVGVLLGFCLTAKVTSTPLLLTIFFLRSWEDRKAALRTCGIAAIIFLLPIFPRWPAMIWNYLHILTHRGDYGSGEAGTPAISDLLANLRVLQETVPEIFTSLALCTAVPAGQRLTSLPPSSRNLMRALLVCTSMFCAALLMVAKQPHPYYLLPEMAFVCLSNAIVVSLLFGSTKIPMWLRMSSIALLLAFLAAQAIRYESRFTQADSTEASAQRYAVTRAAQRGCQTVFYYGANQTEFNLFFGNVTSGRIFGDRLARLYPDFIAYNTGSKLFETFNTTLPQKAAFERFSHLRCVDFLGGKWDSDFGIPASSFKYIANDAGAHLYAFTPPGAEPRIQSLQK